MELQDICNQLNNMSFDELYEYLEDVVDIRYVSNRYGEYLGAYIYIALSPHIWINTLDKYVYMNSGAGTIRCGISDNTTEIINDIIDGFYACVKHRCCSTLK